MQVAEVAQADKVMTSGTVQVRISATIQGVQLKLISNKCQVVELGLSEISIAHKQISSETHQKKMNLTIACIGPVFAVGQCYGYKVGFLG